LVRLLERYRPGVLAVSAEYRGLAVGVDLLHDWGGRVVYMPKGPPVSATSIIKRIKRT
jgi:bifunctional ADP-heptose synthase (sugar kinase/adenylyltransferase)